VHVAALGSSGPGRFGQLALLLHCAPVNGPATGPHLPTAGQLAESTPGIVQATFVTLQTPFVGGHWLLFVQLAPLALHIPTLGQSWFK
jgi:hypothetical protein